MVMLLWLPALTLMFWLESISAVCYSAVYNSRPPCAEALASTARTYPECSSLNFNKEVRICELRSRTDLDALRSGRRALPGVPVSIKWSLIPTQTHNGSKSRMKLTGDDPTTSE